MPPSSSEAPPWERRHCALPWLVCCPPLAMLSSCSVSSGPHPSIHTLHKVCKKVRGGGLIIGCGSAVQHLMYLQMIIEMTSVSCCSALSPDSEAVTRHANLKKIWRTVAPMRYQNTVPVHLLWCKFWPLRAFHSDILSTVEVQVWTVPMSFPFLSSKTQWQNISKGNTLSGIIFERHICSAKIHTLNDRPVPNIAIITTLEHCSTCTWFRLRYN
jgi:hypothetical protein